MTGRRSVMRVGLWLTLLLLLFSDGITARATPPTNDPGPPLPPKSIRAEKVVRDFYVPPPTNFRRAPQTATFNVTYRDSGTNPYGYTCQPWSAQAQAAFQYAVDIWATLVTSQVPIKVDACWTSLGGNVLGSAGPRYSAQNFSGAPQANIRYPAAMADALKGADIYSGYPDIVAQFNANFSWYYGTDGNTPNDKYDFASVVLHELGHGLGFLGSMDYDDGNGSNGVECDGTAGHGCWGYGANPWTFDTSAQDGGGTSLLSYPNNSSQLGSALTSDNVFYAGTNAVAANGGRVKLYAPATWYAGSSYAHLDDNTFDGTANALMTHMLGRGETLHHPGAVTLAMFKDDGWPVSTAAPPTISNVNPNSGPPTTTLAVTITGANFQNGATVKLTKTGQTDINATNVSFVTDSQLTADFPIGGAAVGAWHVVVTNPDAQSATLPNGFTVAVSAPAITSVTPNHGSNDATVSGVTIAGTDFQNGATLKLIKTGQTNINAGNVNVVSDSQLTADFPIGGATVGPWHVVLTNPDTGEFVLPNGFIVEPPFTGKLWTGNINTRWDVAGNWSPVGVPLTTDDVRIPDTSNNPFLTGPAAVNDLYLESGGTLDLLTHTLTISGTVINRGALRQTVAVTSGQWLQALRLTDQSGVVTKYYGMDILPPAGSKRRASAPSSIALHFTQYAFDPLTDADPAPAHLRRTANTLTDGYHVVQFNAPVTADDLAALQATGAEVFDYIPDFAYIVKLDAAAGTRLASLPTVRWWGPYQPAYKFSRYLLSAAAEPTPPPSTVAGPYLGQDSPAEPLTLLVSIFRGEAIEPVAKAVIALGGQVLNQTQTEWQRKLRVRLNPVFIPDLAHIEAVRWIETAPDYQLFNNEAVDVMGVRSVWDTHGLFGAGQTIAVCDSGFDRGSADALLLHDDFEDGAGNSRVAAVIDLVGDSARDTNSGHGTHVAGSVLGNGALSGANPAAHTYPDTAYAGVAPEATLVFQASENDVTGSLSGIPDDLNDLFAGAATYGAKLHTNSWGSNRAGMYTTDAENVDEYAWNHKDFTIFFAAANAGIDNNADGVIDSYSMGSPATAKNAITVGASENNRPNGSTPTPAYDSPWGSGSWAMLYPTDPVHSDLVSDNPAGLAAFSSRGPTLDGRYKPDVVAPGSNIISTRSQAVTFTGYGWGAVSGTDKYMFFGGTSMATPLVAGAGALVRQFYTDQEKITPSAALIKATLVNGATNIAPGQYGTGSTQEIGPVRPTNAAGWGRVNLGNSIFPASPRSLMYQDNTTGLSTGAQQSYGFYVTDSGQPLNVTLAWTDYPGSPTAAGGLVNDLDLRLSGPDGDHYPNNAAQRGTNQYLSYDGGSSNRYFYWQTGAEAAVRVTPTSYPAMLQSAVLKLGSRGSYPKTFSWRITDGDAGGPGNNTLAAGTSTIRESGWHVIDLSGYNVTRNSGDFFIIVTMTDGEMAWYFEDTDVDNRSWYRSGSGSSWTLDADYDYFFHAVVSDEPPATSFDRVNNLVGIDLATPQAGRYTVTVQGYNVAHGPQPFALVVSGAASESLPPTVNTIAPAFADNTGLQAVTINGANFSPTGTTIVRLTRPGEASLVATGVTVSSATQLSATFDFSGAVMGRWHVEVVNPDGLTGTLPDGFTVNGTTVVKVGVSGNQLCNGVSSGAARCFNLTPLTPLDAEVRFYLTEAERNNYALDDLFVYRCQSGTCTQEAGTLTSGGSGDAQYVALSVRNSTGYFALAPGGRIYLPLVLK